MTGLTHCSSVHVVNLDFKDLTNRDRYENEIETGTSDGTRLTKYHLEAVA